MTRTGLMANYRFKTKVVWLFLAALASVFAAFVITSYNWHRQGLNDQMAELRQSADASFHGAVRQETAMLSATLAAILANDRMKAEFRAGNRDTLLRASAPLFAELRQQHAITHLYFVRPDRHAFLRVHQPDRFGDRIDRVTMLATERDQQIAHGLELGPLGTFTLRVVMPWRDGGRLLGYVELGKEIDGIARDMAETLRTGFAVFIDKSALDRDSWEAGMRMLGRNRRWDQYGSVVLVDEVSGTIPDEGLTLFTNGLEHPGGLARFGGIFAIGQHRIGLTALPLTDAAGRRVASMLVAADVTAQFHAMWTSLALVALICLSVGTALAWMFHLILGHVEREHGHTRDKLKAVFDLSPLGMALTSLDGHYLEANDALLAMVGYSRAELLALPPGALIRHHISRRDEAHDSPGPTITGHHGPSEWEYRHRDGRAVAVRLNGVKITGIGGESCIWSIIENITERRQHERELHQAIEHLTQTNTELERF
ncbi:MAG: PAS domain S-box protein, partial [Magnetospirillum sp.]